MYKLCLASSDEEAVIRELQSNSLFKEWLKEGKNYKFDELIG